MYEGTLARRLNVRHVVSFAYARHGLAEAFAARGIGSGDAVLLSPLTCKIVPLSLMSLGIEPVYADITPGSLNLDAGEARANLTPNTKAVLFQHTYGLGQGLAEVASFAEERELVLLEDCAQCVPHSTTDGVGGSYGFASVFSNNLRKPIPAGSGGFVATDDDVLAEALRDRRDGMSHRGPMSRVLQLCERLLHKLLLGPRTYWPLFGLRQLATGLYRTKPLEAELADVMEATRYQATESQYAAGLRWLAHLDDLVAHRRACCADYVEGLRGLVSVDLPWTGGTEPLQFFPVLVDDKPALLHEARKRMIEVVAWPLGTLMFPVEDPSALVSYEYQLGSCPVAEKTAARLVGLPTDLSTKPHHVDAVVKLMRRSCGR